MKLINKNVLNAIALNPIPSRQNKETISIMKELRSFIETQSFIEVTLIDYKYEFELEKFYFEIHTPSSVESVSEFKSNFSLKKKELMKKYLKPLSTIPFAHVHFV